MERFDVVIVGAGLSGIGAACHLVREGLMHSYVILEGRDTSGGTWDLFRYPGIRSDSDMHTLGYSFKPWTSPKAIADGPSILEYIRDTAREYGVDRNIRVRHRVLAAAWSSETKRWRLEVEHDGERRQIECGFLWGCAGYYNYDAGYRPTFPGEESFAGEWIHPQAWPEGFAARGKRIVVVGSGATAVTLVPELAARGARVTMLQRSPTYVAALPTKDPIANALAKRLPADTAYALTRWKNIVRGAAFYRLSRTRPEPVRRWLLGRVEKAVGKEQLQHFTPRYAPWDQRVCVVTDGDMFARIRDGSARVVTGHIDRITATGIQLQSGEELACDVIVTATGLDLKFFGGIALSVDGRAIEPHEHFAYKGMMLSDVPNLILTFGYTNASWTLKADLTAEFTCRILRAMRERGASTVIARPPRDLEPRPFLDFSSGYVHRGAKKFPRQGSKHPWALYQSYFRDRRMLRDEPLEDEALSIT